MLNTDFGNEGITLHSDGTSKFQRHFQNFQITTAEGKTLSTGLFEVAAGDTETLMKAFLQNIEDIRGTISTTEDDLIKEKLICCIKNTMSDKGPTNIPFNKRLQVIREELLPTVIESWNTLSDEAQKEISNMGNYFCKLHLLVNFAEEVGKGFKVYESITFDQFKPMCAFDSDAGSSVFAVVRATCKALLTGHGSDKSGAGGYFQSFMRGKELTMQLADTAHSRMNVVFVNAGSIFHHHEHIVKFLESFPNKNKLLSAVLNDIQENVFLAELKALGIINKIITGPFWRLCESVNHILDLNPQILQMKLCLQRWCNNAQTILDGEETLFPEFTEKDEVWNSLFSQDKSSEEVDSICVQALEIAMNCILLILERQAVDHLPGGKYFQNTKSNSVVPATNIASERDFAILDRLMRCKPSASTTCLEALTLWMNNKTAQWFDSKSENEKKHLMDEARRNGQKIRETQKTRKEDLRKARLEKLEKKQKEKDDSERKKFETKLNLSNKLVETGLWTTETDMNLVLKDLTDKEKREKIVTQINYYKKV